MSGLEWCYFTPVDADVCTNCLFVCRLILFVSLYMYNFFFSFLNLCTLCTIELESLDYTFAADSMGLSSFKFSWWAPKDECVLQQNIHNGPSRSSTVVDFGTDRKRVCDLLLVITSNLGHILPRFRDIAGFLLRRATPPLFHPNFRGVPLGIDCRC